MDFLLAVWLGADETVETEIVETEKTDAAKTDVAVYFESFLRDEVSSSQQESFNEPKEQGKSKN